MNTRHLRQTCCAVGFAAMTVWGLPAAGAATPHSYVNWPSYLFGRFHNSYQSGADAITPANATSLTMSWQDSIGVLSSPTVYNGVIYIGADNGNFYALNESTGAVLWNKVIGTVKGTTCGSRGFASTATVTLDPTTGKPAVYVASPTGYLYAFDAATGSVLWSSVIGIPSTTQNDYFDWSSPAIANGYVYVGVSSQCDEPLVRGGLLSFDQATGQRVAAFYTVPKGSVGGSIWSSPAIDASGAVWVTTGNGPASHQLLGDSESIVKLNGTTLHKEGSWQITNPHGVDSDFGASPTIFSAVLPGRATVTRLVGACNKNGDYYVLNRDDPDAGPVWFKPIGAPSVTQDVCIAAADFDGSHLFMAGPQTTVGGTQYLGSEQEMDPATGDIIWQTGLNGGPDGSSTLDGAGVISVATFDTNSSLPPSADYLLDAANGSLLATIGGASSPEFATPVFADSYLILGTLAGITAYSVSTGA